MHALRAPSSPLLASGAHEVLGRPISHALKQPLSAEASRDPLVSGSIGMISTGLLQEFFAKSGGGFSLGSGWMQLHLTPTSLDTRPTKLHAGATNKGEGLTSCRCL